MTILEVCKRSIVVHLYKEASMRKIIAWAARAGFAAAVALALGFGAQQAFGYSAGGGD